MKGLVNTVRVFLYKLIALLCKQCKPEGQVDIRHPAKEKLQAAKCCEAGMHKEARLQQEGSGLLRNKTVMKKEVI
jgi:hypothetical protein